MKALFVATATACLLAACSAPTSRHRVEIVVNADGACVMDKQSVNCADAARLAAERYTPAGVSAVLLIDPHAPHDSVLTLRSGLQAAHVSHVQYGDPATFHFDRSEPGAEG